MKSLPGGLSLDEVEWCVASNILIHIEGIPAFYYPELLEDQYTYLFRTTRLRWRIESKMKVLPPHSSLLSELKSILAVGDRFQANIAKLSHPEGNIGWKGTVIPDYELTKLVQEYRREMTVPIARIIKNNKVSVVSPEFRAVMLEGQML